MDKDIQRRYQTCGELARDLSHFAAGLSIAARRRSWLGRAWSWSCRRPAVSALATVMVVAAVLAAYFAYSAQSTREELAVVQLEDAVDEALIANMSGDAETANRAIERVAEIEPDTGWLPLLRGHLAFQRGDYDEAVELLKLAVERLPDSVAARSLLAASYVGAGWWERYESILEELPRLTPQSAEDYMFRGLAESYLDPVQARASLDEAMRARRLPAAFIVRAEVCAHLAMDTADCQDADAGVADARLACDLLPDHPAALVARLFAHHVAAGVYEEAGQPDTAQALMAQAAHDAAVLEKFSHIPYVARYRAWFHLYNDREPLAFAILKQAASQTNNSRVAYRYALLLYRRGEFDASLAVLDGRQQRSNNEDLLRVACLLERPNGRELAREAYCAMSPQANRGLGALFRPAVLLLSGEKTAAQEENREFRSRSPSGLPPLRRAFYDRLLQYNCGDLASDDLLETAHNSKWDQCEARFFIGLTQLAEGHRDAAKAHFRAAVATRCFGFLACDWSEIFLIRLERDERWPQWIP